MQMFDQFTEYTESLHDIQRSTLIERAQSWMINAAQRHLPYCSFTLEPIAIEVETEKAREEVASEDKTKTRSATKAHIVQSSIYPEGSVVNTRLGKEVVHSVYSDDDLQLQEGKELFKWHIIELRIKYEFDLLTLSHCMAVKFDIDRLRNRHCVPFTAESNRAHAP